MNYIEYEIIDNGIIDKLTYYLNIMSTLSNYIDSYNNYQITYGKKCDKNAKFRPKTIAIRQGFACGSRPDSLFRYFENRGMWKGISALDCFFCLPFESSRSTVRWELMHSQTPWARS